MNQPDLALYYFEACPFCDYVLKVIDHLKIKVKLNHIYNDPSNGEKLLQDTGRRTTPCLYIDGKPMFESADIVQWLNDNKEHLEKN